MATRPPLSNLSPMAEPWGRDMQERILASGTAIDRLGGSVSNDGRIQNSSMDLMAAQISELYARSSALVRAGNLTTPSFTDNLVSVSSFVSLPAASVPRLAWVSLSCTPSQTGTDDSVVFVTMLLDGQVFYRNSVGLPAGLAPPPGWDGATFVGYSGFTSQSGTGNLELRLQARGFSGGAPRTVTLSGIQATVNFAQKA